MSIFHIDLRQLALSWRIFYLDQNQMKKQLILLPLFLSLGLALLAQCDPADMPLRIEVDSLVCEGAVMAFEPIDTIISNGQCTIRTINLIVLETPVVETTECCDPQQDPLCTTGVFQTILTSSNGCDSMVISTVYEAPQDQFTTEILCQGETFTFEGILIDSDTLISIERFDMGPCSYFDYHTFLFLDTPENPVMNSEICQNDTIIWNGQLITEPGSYTGVSVDMNGCSNTATLNLTQGTPEAILDTISICEGEVLDYDGITIDEAGDYSLRYIGTDPCTDSLLLTVIVTPTEFIEMTTCSDGTILPGIYTEVGDSCEMITLTVLDTPDDVSEAFLICPGDSLEWNGTIYTEPITVSIFLDDEEGCTYNAMLFLEYDSDVNCATHTKDISEAGVVAIHPNPARDLLDVTLNNNRIHNAVAEIYSTSGRLIKKVDLDNQSISISELETGFYFLKLYVDNEGYPTQSFIKI